MILASGQGRRAHGHCAAAEGLHPPFHKCTSRVERQRWAHHGELEKRWAVRLCFTLLSGMEGTICVCLYEICTVKWFYMRSLCIAYSYLTGMHQ